MSVMYRDLRTRAAVITAAFVLALIPTVAHADGFPPTIDGEGTINGSGAGGGNPGGNVPTGGGGGGGASVPEGTKWVYGGIRLTPVLWKWNRTGGIQLVNLWGGNVNGTCPPREFAGDRDWFATGATWQHLVNIDDNSWAGSYSWSCNYPPQPRDYSLTCSLEMTATISQERPTADQRALVSQTTTGAWASDRGSIAKCRRPLSVGVNAPMDRLGGYLVTVIGRTVPCTARTYPGTSRPDRIVRCGNTRTITKSKKGAVWCSTGRVRWATGATVWDGKNWSWDGCTGQTTGLIRCRTADDVGRYAGHVATQGRKVEVIDDGLARLLTFPIFKPGGAIVAIRNLSTALKVHKDSSPKRPEAPVAGLTQPYVFEGPLQVSGDRTKVGLSFQGAGAPGAPFQVAFKREFDADVRVRVTVIKRIDFETLRIETGTIFRTITATAVDCTTPYAQVEVHRARNSTN